MSYEDKTLRCRECETDFVFSIGEQDFFAKHNLLNAPSRCPECRQKRRQTMATERLSGERGPREMHTIVCAECGTEGEVPFLPRQDKPVYCAACYERVRARR
jgi:CxxC-x17-CxxC domain-containing protein